MCSDDYWPLYHLRRFATRMHVLFVDDLNYEESVLALKRMRQSCFPNEFDPPSSSESHPPPSTDPESTDTTTPAESTNEGKEGGGYTTGTAPKERDIFSETVAKVGGRLGFLNKVARHRDMHEMADHLLRVEKASLLSQIGLIADHDEDVMDEVRFPLLRPLDLFPLP